MRMFKRIMELAERMVENMLRQDTNSQLIDDLRAISEDSAPLITKYNCPLSQESLLKKYSTI